MIYTIHKAQLIGEQLRKFSDADSWIVVGQFVNLEFWLEEVQSAMKALDEHNLRFDKIYDSQKKYIESHSIQIPDHCPICLGICELGSGSRKPNLPKKSSETKTDKKESRKKLLDAVYYFLLRCYKLKLLTEDELRKKCDLVGTSIDLDDLQN